eukprot:754041-Hanusia_phi.AAC.4
MALLKAGGREWREGDRVRARGRDVLDQQTLEEAFPCSWQEEYVEGVLLGQNNPRKFVIRWDSLPTWKEVEYGAQHKVFRSSEARIERKRKRNIDLPFMRAPDHGSEPLLDALMELYSWRGWKEDTEEANLDPFVDYDERARLAHSPGPDEAGARGPLWCFKRLFPASLMEQVMEGTNRKFSPTVERMDEQELEEFLVMVLYMAFDPCERLSDYWNESSKCLHCDRQMGKRFGMTMKRWFEIKNALSFRHRERASGDKSDPWDEMRWMVKCFNTHMYQALSPGDCLVLRETSVQWDCSESCVFPQLWKKDTKLQRVGISLRSVRDSETEMVLRLEIKEGTEAMRSKEFSQESSNEHSSSALRLCKKYFGSKRMVIGNGAFASTETARSFLRFGLQFMGRTDGWDVGFPRSELERSLTRDRDGACKTLQCKVEKDRDMFAHGWRDKTGAGESATTTTPLNFFVSTKMITKDKSALYVQRQYTNEVGILEMRQVEIKASDVVKKCLNVEKSFVDFDECMSSGLHDGKLWPTDNFHILFLQHIISLIAVNAYMAHRRFDLHDVGNGQNMSFKRFLGHLVQDFCSHHGPQEGSAVSRQAGRQSRTQELSHTPSSCSSLPSDACKKGRCKELTSKGTTCQCIARYFCPMCSDFSQPKKPKIFYLCGMRSGRDCSLNHVVRTSQIGL